MRSDPKPQEFYRHFKGNIYQIRCLARHTETRERMVVYQAMYGTFEIYVRPLAMFMEEVDRAKYPDVKQKYRFELLQDTDMEGSPEQEETHMVPGDREMTGGEVEKPENTADSAGNGAATQTVSATGGEAAVNGGEAAESDEQPSLDPLVVEFLDADSYEQRLNILVALHSRITNEMINTLAVAVDLEIKDGDVEMRYEELKNCLLTFEKYECNRLR
jgi:hypothetical protein